MSVIPTSASTLLAQALSIANTKPKSLAKLPPSWPPSFSSQFQLPSRPTVQLSSRTPVVSSPSLIAAPIPTTPSLPLVTAMMPPLVDITLSETPGAPHGEKMATSGLEWAPAQAFVDSTGTSHTPASNHEQIKRRTQDSHNKIIKQ